MTNNQTLYILQGVPGSGKSTLAQMMKLASKFGTTVVCSTDNFFVVYNETTGQEEYKFDPAFLSENHAKNLESARVYLDLGMIVVVDNTNIKKAHAKPYVDLAKQRGIPIVIIRVSGNFKSVHNVPDEVVERMRREMEDLTELL